MRIACYPATKQRAKCATQRLKPQHALHRAKPVFCTRALPPAIQVLPNDGTPSSYKSVQTRPNRCYDPYTYLHPPMSSCVLPAYWGWTHNALPQKQKLLRPTLPVAAPTLTMASHCESFGLRYGAKHSWQRRCCCCCCCTINPPAYLHTCRHQVIPPNGAKMEDTRKARQHPLNTSPQTPGHEHLGDAFTQTWVD